MYLLGLSRKEISEKMGRAYSSICTLLSKTIPEKVLNPTKINEADKIEIKKLLLENIPVGEISKKLNLDKYRVDHYYRKLLQIHGDKYKLSFQKSVFEKYEEDGIQSLSDTKMGKFIQILEMYKIKFKLAHGQKKNSKKKELIVKLNCSCCGKELSKNFTSLQSSIKLFETNGGKIHCMKCYKESQPGFGYKRLTKPSSNYWGIQLRKQYCISGNKSADIMMKINGKATYVKGFSDKKYGDDYILIAALFRDYYIIVNDLPNARNFPDEELFKLLKKHNMLKEYQEIKNKVNNLFTDLFVEENNA